MWLTPTSRCGAVAVWLLGESFTAALRCGVRNQEAFAWGCFGLAGSSDDEDAGKSTATRTTTPLDQHSDLWLKNGESSARAVEVTVREASNSNELLVGARYRIPAETILEFADSLRHGREYRFEVTTERGKTSAKTLTAGGCGTNSWNPNGERPVVVSFGDDGPVILFKPCDVAGSGRYRRESADEHERSNPTTETTADTNSS